MPAGSSFGSFGMSEMHIEGVNDAPMSALGTAVLEYRWKTEGQIDKLNHLLDEATYLMTDMLRFGEHEGRCDNLDNVEDSCTLHNAAFAKRRRALEYFVNGVEKIREKDLDKG